jgi:hypothetical protein
MKRLFLIVAAFMLGLPALAHAQSEVPFDYPHAAYMGTLGSQQAERPADIQTPPKENCSKKRCLVVVNNTIKSRVVEVLLDSGARDSVGEVVWSKNLLTIDFLKPQGFIWWTWNQKAKSCKVSVKIVIRAFGLDENELTGNYELCGPKGPGFLVISEPPVIPPPAAPAPAVAQAIAAAEPTQPTTKSN